MGQKDITQKNFEAYNAVFSDIVNGTLFDGREVVKPGALVDAMAKSQYKADDNVIHEQERDVAKYWTDKNCYIRLALLGVENQLAIDKEKTIKHADSFLKLMSVLTQDDKYAEISREISHDEEGFNMCEVLDKAEARGEARGKVIGEAMGEARGKAIGEARGKTIGALNKTVEILRVIIAKNSWSKEQAMEFIGIPKSEFAKYAALL